LLGRPAEIAAGRAGVRPCFGVGVNFATCSTVTQIYKTGLKFGGPSPQKNWRTQNIQIYARRVFWQICDFIANISGLQQDIVNPKTALQTTIIAVP